MKRLGRMDSGSKSPTVGATGSFGGRWAHLAMILLRWETYYSSHPGARMQKNEA